MALAVVGEVGSALQLISFAFEAFNGCLEAYKFIYTAKHLDRDQDSLCSQLLFEDARLKQWASRAGLPDQAQKRLDWQTIVRILQYQEKLVTSADELRRRYKLNTTEVPEEAVDDGVALGYPSQGTQDTPAPGSTGILLRLRTRTFSNSIRGRPNVGKTIRRIQWAAVGKEKTTKVVEDISALNGRLYEMLDLAAQDEARDSMHALLRDAVSRCTNTGEIFNIQALLRPDSSTDTAAIDAAAQLRGLRIFMKDERREEQAVKAYAGKVPVKIWDEAKLDLRPDEYNGMALGRYNEQSILIEWRVVREVRWDDLQKPMRELAALLSVAQDRAFHNLQCAGLFELPGRDRFGLVFEIPGTKSSNDIDATKAGTLLDMLTSIPRASLADRIRIGRDISEAVVQLHTSGWLHKGIRSENVFFITAAGTKSIDLLRSEPYLVGYVDSRPATNEGAVLTELPLRAPHADLYRHPAARGASRQEFKKRFDMYALACVLTELALWKPLDQILADHASDHEDGRSKEAEHGTSVTHVSSLCDVVISTKFIEEILHCIGPGYLEAIKLCLGMQPSRSDEEEASLRVQGAVLRQLRLCKL